MFHCAASSVLHRLFSSCGTRASHCSGFSASLLWNMHLGYVGFSSYSTWTQELQLSGSRAQAEWLWPTGLVAPQHEGSFRIRDGTRVSCIGRQTPYHWATREALLLLLLSRFSRVRLCATHRRQPTRLPRPRDSPGKNTGVGCRLLFNADPLLSKSFLPLISGHNLVRNTTSAWRWLVSLNIWVMKWAFCVTLCFLFFSHEST